MLFAFLLVPMLSSLTVLADPPPGTPEVSNTYCSTWSNGTGICDDYNFAHDLSSSDEWVRSNYLFEMHNTTSVTMTLEWEMHEFNSTLIGLEGLNPGGGFNNSTSGAPVDYIRNYLGHTTQSGLQVRQMIMNEFSAAVELLVNETYNGTAEVESQIVNSVQIEGQTIQCSDDPLTDSADEVAGLENNAFQPPLCLKSVARIVVADDILNLSDEELDIERAFKGLLTMGAEISSNFTLIERPGHRATYELTPPDYATFSAVDASGGMIPHQVGGFTYHSASWMTDGLALIGGENMLANGSFTTVLRESSTTSAVSIDSENDHGISIRATADIRDADNSILTAEMDIHFLPQDVLEEWGFTLGQGNIVIPWITSDGIRLAYEYGLLDLDEFTDMVPLQDVETAVFNASEVELVMNNPNWKAADTRGGLNFTHSPGVTCAELTAHSHCLSGATAMNGTYPVTMVTRSEPFPADPLEKLTEIISGMDRLENVTEVAQEDLSAILSVLVYEHQVNTSFITDALPDWLPPTEIEVEVLLPDWIASDVGDPRTITLTASSRGGEEVAVALTGPNPYHRRWSDPICDVSAACGDNSADLICKSEWKSCINIEARVNIPDFAIHEWTQEIELTVEATIDVELYRLEVPQSLIDDYGITAPVIPSDLVRHLIAYGDEQQGGLNGLVGETVEIPLGDTTHDLEISNNGLQAFADSIAAMMNQEMSTMAQSDEMLTIDLSGLRFSASVERLARPLSPFIDDDEPLLFTLQLQRTKVSGRYSNGGVVVDTSSGLTALPSLFHGMLGVFDARTASGDGLVTVPNEPLLVEVQPLFIDEDIDPDFDSDGDGEDGNDRDLVIRPSVLLELTMPTGLEVEFSSELGRDEQSMLAGSRKKIVYRLPLCTYNDPIDCKQESDEISLQFTVGYAFLLQELIPYLIGLLLLIGMLVWRRQRKKAQQRAATKMKQQQIRSVAVNTHAVEREMLGLAPMADGGYTGGSSGDSSDWFDGLDMSEEW